MSKPEFVDVFCRADSQTSWSRAVVSAVSDAQNECRKACSNPALEEAHEKPFCRARDITPSLKYFWELDTTMCSASCRQYLHFLVSIFPYACNVQLNLSLRPPDKSDHLKIADTEFQSLEFADSNVRSAFLKMRPPEKCELRTPKVGPKRWSNLQKATTYVKLSKKHFFDCLTFFAGTPNERSSRLEAPFGKVVANHAPAYTWEPPIANVMARAGACVQLHMEIFWTKPGKWDHLKNRTTYSQSLRWS